MFRSLSVRNYRLWFFGALVSNSGTWMQRTAQDWIVLTDLTDHDAVAVGITMALQLGPQLVLAPMAGLLADRVNRRHLLMFTQAAMGVLGLGLGLLVLLGTAELWEVYLFALATGAVSAFDAPVRQTFVSELVAEKNIPNAVALNSASFNGARLIGPALAGVLLALVGAGFVFLLNGVTFAATLFALVKIRPDQLQPAPRVRKQKGQIRAGLSYVRSRPDIVIILVMILFIGTFGFNFAIFVSTMTTVVFHQGAGAYGALSSILAIGSVAGALLAARRDRPRLRLVVGAAFAFGIACTLAALAPSYLTFALAAPLIGITAMTAMNSANSYVQISTLPAMRGRVMALYMAIMAGGTPIGAPFAGWVANQFGPRWSLGVAAISGLLAGAIAVVWMIRARHLRVRYDRDIPYRLAFSHDGLEPTPTQATAVSLATEEITIQRG
ncbi:MFS transporter [Glaciihabitans sp. dw_435]|uniref:MFS transporter n=1 Tax=Glaciihabitans sp. dw_435 TaxID=2720081 RepID=UPI001BD48FDB